MKVSARDVLKGKNMRMPLLLLGPGYALRAFRDDIALVIPAEP